MSNISRLEIEGQPQHLFVINPIVSNISRLEIEGQPQLGGLTIFTGGILAA